MADEGWMTTAEIATRIGVTEYSVRQALLALGLFDGGKKDLSDRRRIIYPPGTHEKVKQWLETH